MLGVGQFFDDLKEGYQTPSFSCLLSRKFSPLPIFHVFQVELKLGGLLCGSVLLISSSVFL